MKGHLRRWRRSILPASALVWFALAVFAFGIAQQVPQQTSEDVAKTVHLQQHDYAELTKAPEKARNRSNPLAADPDAVGAGRKLFEQHCAECHGNTAAGGRKAPSLRAEEVRIATPGTIFWILTNGVVRRGMPVWSRLPEQQRWQIVSYLKSLN